MGGWGLLPVFRSGISLCKTSDPCGSGMELRTRNQGRVPAQKTQLPINNARSDVPADVPADVPLDVPSALLV